MTAVGLDVGDTARALDVLDGADVLMNWRRGEPWPSNRETCRQERRPPPRRRDLDRAAAARKAQRDWQWLAGDSSDAVFELQLARPRETAAV